MGKRNQKIKKKLNYSYSYTFINCDVHSEFDVLKNHADIVDTIAAGGNLKVNRVSYLVKKLPKGIMNFGSQYSTGFKLFFTYDTKEYEMICKKADGFGEWIEYIILDGDVKICHDTGIKVSIYSSIISHLLSYLTND